MKKTLALILTLCLLMAVPAYAIEDPIPNQTAFPLTQEPITLQVFNWAHNYTRGEFGTQKIWERMEKLTNVHLEFETYRSDIEQHLNVRMADEVLPDVIYKVGLDNATVLKLAKDGVIVPITDYLKEYAPHYWYQIENEPALKNFVTMEDGEIYGFTYIVSAPTSVATGINVRKQWLTELGYEDVPTDLQELKELLIKFRDSDLNGNGEKDEVGLISRNYTNLLWYFYGAFGIGTRGKTAAVIDLDENGALRYIPTSDNYRELLKYFSELYQEGLIYSEIFSMTDPILAGVGESNRVLMILNGKQYLGSTYFDEYQPTTATPVAADGTGTYAFISSPVNKQCTFITADNKHIKETLQYFDYFYSKEGVEEYFMGVEGETFYRDENGNPHYTDFVVNNPDGLTYEEALGTYTVWSGGKNPTMAEGMCFGSNIMTAPEREVWKALAEKGVQTAWSEFSYSNEDYSQLAIYKSDIDSYVNNMTASFITGTENINDDATWNAYLQKIKDMGYDKMMAIYQRGLDRYFEVTGVR